MKPRQSYQLSNAQFLQSIKGTRAAAKYLRFCGFSVEAALFILLGV